MSCAFELTELVLDWLEQNYPGEFRRQVEAYYAPLLTEVISAINRVYDQKWQMAALHVCQDKVYLFNSDPEESDAYDTIKAADPNFFNKISECVEKYWLHDHSF